MDDARLMAEWGVVILVLGGITWTKSGNDPCYAYATNSMVRVPHACEDSGKEANRKPNNKNRHSWWVEPAFIVGIALFLLGGSLNYFASNPRILYLGAAGVSILVFFFAHQYITSVEGRNNGREPSAPDPTAMTGMLKAEPTLLFSSGSPVGTLLEIGNSGSRFLWTGKQGSPMFQIGEDPLTVERLASGDLAVTTTIRDASGKIIAEIVRNEWKLRPSLLWDRNFNANAVEVRGESGDVVLQVRALADRIQMQATWYTSAGRFFELAESPDAKGGVLVQRPEQRIPIKPIFRYPSDQHLGELLSN